MAITGWGYTIASVVIGPFPHLLVYMGWLYVLANQLRRKLHTNVIRYLRLDGQIRVMKRTIVIILPLYWVLVNLEIHQYTTWVFVGTGLVSLFYFIYFCFTTWLTLARCLSYLTAPAMHQYDFDHYSKLFFLFLFGPITIWWLQPVIMRALEGSDPKKRK